MGRKLQAISRRANSGHPLFVGEGRTGESPILHTKTSTERVLVFLFYKANKKWDLNEEKICISKFPLRVNGGHPPFIGDGRTGESPILHTANNLN